MRILKRYRLFLITLGALSLTFLLRPEVGALAVETTLYSFKEMVLVLPPVFLLLGLLDTWVPREVLVRHMGAESGLKGGILAMVIGSAAAGPLYGAFPVAAVLMRKGVSFSNIMVFIGAWSTTKIPMVLFEVASMGLRFTLTRLAASIVGIFLIAKVVSASLSEGEVEALVEGAKTL